MQKVDAQKHIISNKGFGVEYFYDIVWHDFAR